MDAYVRGIGDIEESKKPFSDEVLDAIWEHSLKSPERSAFINASNPQQKLTFGQFHKHCLSIRAFLHKKGLHKGDIVCVLHSNSWIYPALFLGVSQLGGILSGVSVSYTKFEIQRHFNDCRPRIVFACRQLLDVVLEAAKSVPSIQLIIQVDNENKKSTQKSIPQGIIDFNDVLKTPPTREYTRPLIDVKKDIVVLPYSSGTTGLPKGVKLTNQNMSSLLHTYTWYAKRLLYPHLDTNFDPTHEYFLHFLPQHHMFGFSMMLIGLVHGFTGIVIDKYKPELLLECVQEYQIKHLHIVPPISLLLAKSPLTSNYDLSSLRSIYNGAAPIGQQLREELKQRLGLKSVTQGYGLTESTLSFFRPTYSNDPPMSSGQLQGRMEAKIIDPESGLTLKRNQTGELCVRGALVMAGYLNNDKATRETFTSDGWLKTGDLSFLDTNGYLFVVDRLKEVIKVNGRQVAPAELEALLQGHPKVQDAAVIGIPDNKHGEVPKAFVVKKDKSLNTEELHGMLKDKVASFKQLKGGIKFVNVIPKSPSGKILRRKLKELHDQKAKL